MAVNLILWTISFIFQVDIDFIFYYSNFLSFKLTPPTPPLPTPFSFFLLSRPGWRTGFPSNDVAKAASALLIPL